MGSRGGTERRPATLANLAAQKAGLLCCCNGCRHSVSVPIGFAVALFGRNYPVPDVAGRLRCSKCGSRDVVTMPDWPSFWPSKPGTAGTQAAVPSEEPDRTIDPGRPDKVP